MVISSSHAQGREVPKAFGLMEVAVTWTKKEGIAIRNTLVSWTIKINHFRRLFDLADFDVFESNRHGWPLVDLQSDHSVFRCFVFLMINHFGSHRAINEVL
jgi:hypothetical protein